MDQRAAMYQSLKDEIAALRKEVEDLRDAQTIFLTIIDKVNKRYLRHIEAETELDVRLHAVEVRIFPKLRSTLRRLTGLIGFEFPITDKLDRRDGDDLPPQR